jgi:hypothetical protein
MDDFEFESLFGSLKKVPNAPVSELPDPLDLNWELSKPSAKATPNVSAVLRRSFIDDVAGDTFEFESPSDTAVRKMDSSDVLQKRAKNIIVKFADGVELANPAYDRETDSWSLDGKVYKGEVKQILSVKA